MSEEMKNQNQRYNEFFTGVCTAAAEMRPESIVVCLGRRPLR